MANKPSRPKSTELIGLLPDWAIREHLQKEIIKIDPLPKNWEEKVDPVSIDFRLGKYVRVFTNDGLGTIDTKYTTKEEMEKMMPLIELKDGQPLILTKGKFVIATTFEKLTLPKDIVGHLHGKSSLARLGVLIHSTAARFDPGYDGYPVLEIGTILDNKEIVLYQGAQICAFSFERMAAPAENAYTEKSQRKYGEKIPGVSKPVN
ncbi:MAG: dCTP deaminase [bacterium]|nr:dCTP deaminase [bacterium]